MTIYTCNIWYLNSFSFEEKEVTMFRLSPNQVLSTLASRNKASEISAENLSKSILDRLMIYFSKE